MAIPSWLASPTPSSSLPCSGRSSTDRHSTTSPLGPQKNRSALLDYYGIQSEATSGPKELRAAGSAETATKQADPAAPNNDLLSQLDQPQFDAQQFVRQILEKDGLEGAVLVANSLADGIGKLESDRKSLVYDNYSKLIAATDTILKMRMSMEPLTPATSTLSPTLAKIASTASAVANSVKGAPGDSADEDLLSKQRTVRYVLGTPARLRSLIRQGKRNEALQEWSCISSVLDKWASVPGTSELRAECAVIMDDSSTG